MMIESLLVQLLIVSVLLLNLRALRFAVKSFEIVGCLRLLLLDTLLLISYSLTVFFDLLVLP